MSTTTMTKPDNYRDFDVPIPDLSEIGECGDPVGVLEMADRLHMKDRSIHMVRRRGQLPRPDYETVNGSRAWEWSTILWWAGETDRLRTPELRQQYRETFGVDPPSGKLASAAASTWRIAPGSKSKPGRKPTVPSIP